MENKRDKEKKVPVRSSISDEELAAIIRCERDEHPTEFEEAQTTHPQKSMRYYSGSSANEVIAKWL